MENLISEILWPAPAKLNLFLHITGQRHDGYHEIQTVFQFLDFYDELFFNIRSDHQIILKNPIAGIADQENLVIKAAQKLQSVSKNTGGVNIFLRKHIPIGSGLGGGSSNAATTLVALNKLWKLNLSQTELLQLGLELGADVPVFINGHAAWAEGIGDKLTPINLPEVWHVVIIPPVAISTAKIFSATELTRNTGPITIHQFLAHQPVTHNDCEPLVKKLYPAVAEALDWLSQFAPAKLTGTGSCVFASLETQEEACAIVEKVPKSFRAFSAKGINISPLLGVSPSGKARGFDPRIPRFES